ncbi:Regulatory cys-3 protein [Rutstroemia sp. NJR-2017a WRK4]|nr:Regulatory cys-3 protein [Rutstroemia sp. NJR-2017a WRK4]
MTYNGRRGPNVSEYIANLNAIPTPQDIQNSSQENFNIDDDLAMFTNTQFFDFDLGQNTDLQAPNFDGVGAQSTAGESNIDADLKDMNFDIPALDTCSVPVLGKDMFSACSSTLLFPSHLLPSSSFIFSSNKLNIYNANKMMLHSGDFTFPDFNAFSQAPSYDNDSGISRVIHPIQTAHPIYPPSSSAGSPTSALVSPQVGEKRKAESLSEGRSPDFEDASRMAAEEDKRRRNTAASARFRVKKKQREQALERSAKEMSDKVAALEGRINQLETENKWLKNLITEKNESKEDVAALWKKYNQESGDRKGSERKDGVGTKA